MFIFSNSLQVSYLKVVQPTPVISLSGLKMLSLPHTEFFMIIQSTLATPLSAAHRLSDWESAAMGLEFLFIWGYNLRKQVKGIESHLDSGSNITGANPKIKPMKWEVQV